MSQYAVSSQFGMVDIDEGNAGDQYMVAGTVGIDEPTSNGGTFFLLFDLSWVAAIIYGLYYLSA